MSRFVTFVLSVMIWLAWSIMIFVSIINVIR